MPDGKWVSKANLQTFWQMIRSKSLPTMVGDTVTTWLNNHVTPTGSAVVVDDTLTIAGAAADAKKTGDEISGLKSAINGIIQLESGTFSDADGVTKTVRVSRIRTKNPIYIKKLSVIDVPDGYSSWIFMFDENINFISALGSWHNGNIPIKMFPNNVYYINIAFRNNSNPNGDISAEVQTLQFSLKTVSSFEENIEMSNTVLFDSSNMQWSANVLLTFFGSVSSVNNYYTTDYVDVSKYKGLLLTFCGHKYTSDTSGICFYDENKNYLKGCNPTTYGNLPLGSEKDFSIKIQIPTNAAFFRFCVFTNAGTKAVKIYCTISDVLNQISIANVLKDTEFGGGLGSGTSQSSYESYPVLPNGWEAHAGNALDAVSEKIQELGFEAVPIFIETDSHGNSIVPFAWLNQKDASIKCVHLGDIVTDTYNKKELESYYSYAKKISNICSVVGNHEVNYGSEIMHNYDVVKCLPSTTRKLGGYTNYYTVDDDDYRIRYIALDPYVINSDNVSSSCVFGTDQIKWLITSLASSPYDAVILSHNPLCNDENMVNRSGTVIANSGPYPINLDAVRSLLSAYQTKTSVTLSINGESIQADFTNVSRTVLCCLAGHTHAEGTAYEFGARHYIADNFMRTDWATTFIIIDRSSNMLMVYKFDCTQNYSVWNLSLNA